MNIKEIKQLAQIMEKSGLTLLEVTENDTNIKLERKPELVSFSPTEIYPAPMANTQSLSSDKDEDLEYHEIVSPMVGVCYMGSAPDAEPFVEVGTEFKKGDILCIIEAMKVMNEIQAETDGKIVEICVENGQFVEYGQCLFKID